MNAAPRKTGRARTRGAVPAAMTATPPPLALPHELTIYSVGELRPSWLDRLGASSADETLAVDGAAVDEVDAAGVQLLLSLAHALARDRRRLQLLRPSAALTAACTALGAQSLLDDAGACA